MPSGVYQRTPEQKEARAKKFAATMRERYGEDWAKKKAEKAAKAAKANKKKKAAGKRDYRAERVRRKQLAAGKGAPRHPGRRRQTVPDGMTAYEAKLTRRAKKQMLLQGPLPKQHGNAKFAPQVVVLEADGTLATYVLTTVRAYVRQP
jgi:hypothetical protein